MRNILINKKNYKDLVIYFAIYDVGKSKRILNPYYNKLMGTIEEHEGKRYFIVCHCVLNKVLDKIKEIIGTGKFADTKNLINTDHQLPYCINLKNVMMLMTSVIIDYDEFYLQLFLEEALHIAVKGVHTPPFLDQSTFSKIPPFLEIQDVPTFYRPIRKTKKLKDPFN